MAVAAYVSTERPMHYHAHAIRTLPAGQLVSCTYHVAAAVLVAARGDCLRAHARVAPAYDATVSSLTQTQAAT